MSTFDFEAFNQAYEQINHYERLQNIQRTIHAPGKITVSLDITEQHLSSPGAAHGGSMSGFMDVVLGYAALTKALPEGNVVSTIEFKMNFLKPIFLGDKLRGEGEVLSAGKRIIVTDGRVYRNEELVATGQGTFNTYPLEKKNLL